MSLTAIFFDAGGTLVFPDTARTLAPLAERGLAVTQEQLYAAEREAKREFDRNRSQGAAGVDALFWQTYYSHLLRDLGLNDPELHAALVRETRRGLNWSFIRPDTRPILERLHRRFRIGLISNSDGTVQKLFEQLGLADYFDAFVDSRHCGYEKPDPRIFQAALAAVNAQPESSLYVGDVYSIDYVGAQAVGMQAILMDAAGTYRDTRLARVESLAELEKSLQADAQSA